MVFPEQLEYKDVHGGMTDTLTQLTVEKLNTYMEIHSAKWKKVESLYKER